MDTLIESFPSLDPSLVLAIAHELPPQPSDAELDSLKTTLAVLALEADQIEDQNMERQRNIDNSSRILLSPSTSGEGKETTVKPPNAPSSSSGSDDAKSSKDQSKMGSEHIESVTDGTEVDTGLDAWMKSDLGSEVSWASEDEAPVCSGPNCFSSEDLDDASDPRLDGITSMISARVGPPQDFTQHRRIDDENLSADEQDAVLDAISSDTDEPVELSLGSENGEDSLSFLQSVFPTRSTAFLFQKLTASPNRSIDHVVDEILTEDYMANQAYMANQSDSEELEEPETPAFQLYRKDHDGMQEDGRAQHRKRKKNRTTTLQDASSASPLPHARPKLKQFTVSLTDVRQGGGRGGRRRVKGNTSLGLSDSAPDPSDLLTASSSNNRLDTSHTDPGENRWATIDSISHHLSQLLDVTPMAVTSLYHRCDSDFTVMMDRILQQLEAERPFDSLKLPHESSFSLSSSRLPQDQDDEGTVQRENLLMMFSQLCPNKDKTQLQRYLAVTRGDVDKALDLVAVVDRVRNANDGSAFGLVGKILMQRRRAGGFASGTRGSVSGGSANHVNGSVAVLHADSTLESMIPLPVVAPSHDTGTTRGPTFGRPGWNVVPPEAFISLPQSNPSTPLSATAQPFVPRANTSQSQTLSINTATDRASLSESIANARYYREQRDSAYRNAARHYQNGRTGGSGNSNAALRAAGERGAASIWSDEGREMNRRMQIWELKVAQGIVNERRLSNPNTVDLHGLTVNQALTVVKESTNTWWSHSRDSSPTPLRIITGAGRHSENQTPVLLPAVGKLLDREGWSWRYEGDTRMSGVFLVRGVKPANRP